VITAKYLRSTAQKNLLPGKDLARVDLRFANSAIVSSPFSAFKATLALNVGLRFFRLCFMSCFRF